MAKKRSRTREARQRRQRQRRRNRRSLLLLGLVLVAVVAIAIIVVSSQPVEAHIPPDLPKRYQALDRSVSPEGYPQLGDQSAPVKLEEFASFSCPGCEALHSQSFDALLERLRSGQIVYTYVPMQTGSIPNAPGAARAALCAGQQGMFWEMRDVLFDWQTRYANTAFSQNRLLAGVEALGLHGGAFTTCFNSAAISDTLTSAMTEDVTGTPTLRVNGVTVEAQRAGSIPTTAEIMRAIDDATPDDWNQDPGDVVEESAPDEAEDVEPTVAPSAAPTDEPPPTDTDAPPPTATDAPSE